MRGNLITKPYIYYSFKVIFILISQNFNLKYNYRDIKLNIKNSLKIIASFENFA